MAVTTSLAIAAASAAIQVAQAQQAAKARNKANNAAYAAQARQVQLAQKIQERQRKQVLSQETATRRAKFGGTESARRGQENALTRRAGLQSSLVNVQNSNRLALLEADHKSQGAIFGAVAKGLTAGAAEFQAPPGPPRQPAR